MKFLLAVVTFISVTFAQNYANSQNSTVETKWIIQQLDHFDKNNQRTWNMRYMVTEKYFQRGSPMFIYLGNEVAIEAFHFEYGLLADLAREHNGIMFYTEHRYYGQSKPTSDLSMESLKYLNSKQTLADIAHFIKYQRKNDPRLAESKVFISGCSYSGSLALWFSRLYPDLVDATWSISAPLVAKLDYKEYYEILGEDIKEFGSLKCYNRIKNGIQELEKMFSEDRAAQAIQLLNICKDDFDIGDEMNLWILFTEISRTFTALLSNPLGAKQAIAEKCDLLMKEKDDLTAIVKCFKEKYLKDRCVISNYNANYILFSNATMFIEAGADRRWLYQMCNEFGWFQTSSSKKQPFGTKIRLSGNIKLCGDIFSENYTEASIQQSIQKTNSLYGAYDRYVKNAYVTHCSADMWSALVPYMSAHVSIVPKCFHCAHIYSINAMDSPEMRDSKQRLFTLAREWLA